MTGGWTIETIKEHFEALRAADQRALQIKEQGDAKALNLERETQQYKDEKANQLREQINSERGLYVTKAELKPFTDYITAQQGQIKGSEITMGKVIAIVGISITILGFLISLVVLGANGKLG